ncbi:MAG: M24 family metallopeptidase [Thermomicrobia bacterium]|nr:M24 family metallopeptidase [Thermomicrobia bacterium]
MMAPFDSAKLADLMDEAEMDLLLASTRHNVRYLTGGYVYHFHERGQRMGSTQYLAFVGVPRGRVMDACYIGAPGERLGLDVLPLWIGERNLEAGDASSSAVAAATAAKSLGVANGTIGVEMPFLPASALAALQTGLPGATFVDATDLLHELRAIKTEAEIAVLREVSDRVATAIQAGFRAGYDGVPTRELAATVEREMSRHGVTFLWAFTNAGPGYLRAPSETRWERGRMLHLDCGGEGQDYLADICRMGALGAPSALGKELTEASLEIQGVVRRQLRAGMTYGEVNAAAQDALAANSHATIGRIVAHGIGMVSHEQPMINRPEQAQRTLQNGHILSLETEFLHRHRARVAGDRRAVRRATEKRAKISAATEISLRGH